MKTEQLLPGARFPGTPDPVPGRLDKRPLVRPVLIARQAQAAGLPSRRIRSLTSALPASDPSCQLPISLSMGVGELP